MIRFSTKNRSTKIQFLALLWSMMFLLGLSANASLADEGKKDKKAASSLTVNEQILGLETMCSANAKAMAEAKPQKSLYERLGGEEKIRAIIAEIVRLHAVNEDFERFMGDVDQEKLIDGVTDFLVQGAGGPARYTGRDMVKAHAHLKLTNADFLSAGVDVMQAMKNKGCQQTEINEVICMLVSLRDQVVIDADKVVAKEE